MDIPVPVQNYHHRVEEDRVITDVEISLGENRTRAISIELHDKSWL
jgi:hypothetical protein